MQLVLPKTTKKKIHDIPIFDKDSKTLVWKSVFECTTEDPYIQWGLTKLAREACKLDDKYYISKELPKTDSRLRPDRIGVEKLDYTTAAEEKDKLEVAQRKTTAQRGDAPWVPVFFEKQTLENNVIIYNYKKNYEKK